MRGLTIGHNDTHFHLSSTLVGTCTTHGRRDALYSSRTRGIKATVGRCRKIPQPGQSQSLARVALLPHPEKNTVGDLVWPSVVDHPLSVLIRRMLNITSALLLAYDRREKVGATRASDAEPLKKSAQKGVIHPPPHRSIGRGTR